jgi:preprotein translocase subunit YajC
MLTLIAQNSGNSGNSLVAFAPLLLLGGVMYFLLIRPQQRRTRAQQALLGSLEVGDEVLTTSGMLGTIVDVDEDEGVLTVEIAPGTRVRMVKGGVARRLVEEDDEDADAGGAE